MRLIIKFILFLLLFFNLLLFNSYSEIINKINIIGNERVSSETVEMFAKISINDDINPNQVNNILKNIYDSNFFEDVQVNLENGLLSIIVKEYPLIQNISYNGIKANKIREPVLKNLNLKPRSSFNKILLEEDKNSVLTSLRDLGYYFSSVEILTRDLKGNKVDINFNINLGKKAKIKKIKFIGDKVFKDKKLKNIIISEEFKFWKVISGKKYLNENIISLDTRLLKNFYLNKGYYNVKINSSFAKLITDDSFELIFNIDAKNKIYFNNLELILPTDYNKENFSKLNTMLKNYEGEIYSFKAIENILDEIDEITLLKQYQSIKASVNEKITDDKIDLRFIIEETDKYFVEKINIFGNNVTRENVIRNQFEIDEGDPFNEILHKKTVNNIKSLNFFKNVKSEILPGTDENNKIINISIEEKPTGEILMGAGVGTSGGSFAFGIKENNFLGKGISIKSDLELTSDSVKGLVSFVNPNFLDSDKLVSMSVEASELDNLKDFGYKTNKTGFSVNTKFEYFDKLFFGIGTSNYYEKIETNSTASTRQKSQEGDYYDSFLSLDFDYDNRNQKFQTSKGFRSYYSIDVPVISKTNSLSNSYNYNYYTELYDQNISTFSFFLKNTMSITGDDIKLSERLYIPSKKLRGFERGKVGPKDGKDFIGGNSVVAMNFASTLPTILENSQNTDFLIFMDVANIWGVDYNSSLDSSNKIRSSVGLGVDWFTPIGPLNFSLAHPITKNTNDKTETFRFNLGTTF